MLPQLAAFAPMNEIMENFRAGMGSSRLPDATAAGRDAAEQALQALDGASPALVITYASMRYDLTELLAAIRAVTGEAPLVGATSSGQLLNGELIAPGEGVCVTVLTAGPYQFGVASCTGLGTDSYQAGQALARAALAELGGSQPEHSALLVLADSLSGDLQNLLNGVYRVAGAKVPVVGGAAGADRDLSATYVFHDGTVFNDGAAAVWIAADRPLNVVFGHGWNSHGLPMMVTGVDGPIVHEIDGRPALEVYQEKFRTPQTPEEADLEWWQGFHPSQAFGLIEPDGSEVIRGAYIDADGRPRTFTPLPPHSAIRVMTAESDSLLDVCERVVTDALGDRRAGVLLMFSCSARMEILGDRAAEEAVLLQKAAGTVPTVGFYTYGEFARNAGISGYHNATLAALAL